MWLFNNTLIIPDLSGGIAVEIPAIVRIEARSNYSKLYLENGKCHIVTKVLRQFEDLLGGKGFARIHRSHLVNTAFISAYHAFRSRVSLVTKEELSISRRRGVAVREKLLSMAFGNPPSQSHVYKS